MVKSVTAREVASFHAAAADTTPSGVNRGQDELSSPFRDLLFATAEAHSFARARNVPWLRIFLPHRRRRRRRRLLSLIIIVVVVVIITMNTFGLCGRVPVSVFAHCIDADE